MKAARPRIKKVSCEPALRRLIEATLELHTLPDEDERFLRSVLARNRIAQYELEHVFRVHRLLDAADEIAVAHRALAGRILRDPAANNLPSEHRSALMFAIACIRFGRAEAAGVVRAANAFNRAAGRPIASCVGGTS